MEDQISISVRSSGDSPEFLPPPRRAPAPRDGRIANTSRRRQFVDVTSDFWQTCSQLALGQMVHPPTFTLLDTMACISIGDPRMDSGIHPLPSSLVPEADRRDDTAASSSATFNPYSSLTAQDVAWIMDRLTACEAAFHKSAPLSQTLYTCLYFHDIEALSPRTNPTAQPLASPNSPHPAFAQLVLQAYLVATVKCFGLVWSELAKGNIHEGEDAVTDTCGKSLFEHISTNQTLHHLKAADAWLRHCRATLTASGQSKEPIDGLIHRLSFRRKVFMLLTVFNQQLAPEGQQHDLGGRSSPDDFACMVRDLTQELTQKLDILKHPALHGAVSLKAAPSRVAAASFDPSYGRRLQNAGGVPPRPIDLPSKEKILELWHRNRCHWAQAGLIYASRPASTQRNSWDMISTFTCTLGALFIEQPSTAFDRSLFQSCLLPPGAEDSDLFLQSLLSIAGIDLDLWTSRVARITDPHAHGRLMQWLNKGESLVGNVILETMANRPRAKRSLHRSYAQWASFAAETELLEPAWAELELGPTFLSSILHIERLDIALQIIMAGFDLQLYSATERCMAYWLGEHLGSERRQLREKVDQMLEAVGAEIGDLRPLADDWIRACCAAWKYLVIPPLGPLASSSTAPWTDTEEHSRDVFRRRFKWLRGVPTLTLDGRRGDRFAALDALWQQFRSDQLETLAAAPSTSAMQAMAHLQDASRQIGCTVESMRGDRWTLCREEAEMLYLRLAFTIRETMRRLLPIAGKEFSSDQPFTDGMFGEKHQAPHPWFPLLQQHIPPLIS